MSVFIHLISYFSIRVAKAIFPFLLLPVFTKFLSQEDFGIMSLWLGFYALGLPLLSFGAKTTLSSEYYQDKPEEFATKFTTALLIPIVFIAIFIVVTASIVLGFYDNVEFNPIWNVIIGGLLLTQLLPQFTLSAFRFEQKVKLFAGFSVGYDFFLYGGIFILLLMGLTWQSRFLGLLAGNLIFSVIGLLYLKKRGFLKAYISKDYLKKHLKTILPLLPVVLFLPASLAIDKWFLLNKGSKPLLGFFEVGLQASSIILMIGTTVGTAWQPKLYQWLSEKKEGFEKVVVKQTYLVFGLVVLAFLGLQLIKELAFYWLIDAKFVSGLAFVLPLSLAFVFFAWANLMVGYLIFTKKTERIGGWSLLLLILKIGLNYWIISAFGVSMLVWNFPLIFLIFSLLIWWEANKEMSINWFPLLNNK
mgnify:CR=1 FL=1